MTNEKEETLTYLSVNR